MVAKICILLFDLNQANSLITNLIIENKIDINQFQAQKHNI